MIEALGDSVAIHLLGIPAHEDADDGRESEEDSD